MSSPDETMVPFTGTELTVLNRLFNVLGEEQLRANYFTRADIETTYAILEKTREALEEWQLSNVTETSE